MICEHCGTELADCSSIKTGERHEHEPTRGMGFGEPGALHTAERCLKAQLASMTKRAEDAEREKTELLDTILTPEDYAKSSQDLWAQAVQADKEREAAKAKLATAVEGLREIAGRALSYAGWAAECARSTLRALGIDPSKETP